MPTDDVLSLIADVRQLCDAMPSGPFAYDVPPKTFLEIFPPHIPTTKARFGDEWVNQTLSSEHHARYFAALDPALVRALLRLAEAILRYPQGTSWADYDELVAAEDDLCRLAADRVTEERK